MPVVEPDVNCVERRRNGPFPAEILDKSPNQLDKVDSLEGDYRESNAIFGRIKFEMPNSFVFDLGDEKLVPFAAKKFFGHVQLNPVRALMERLGHFNQIGSVFFGAQAKINLVNQL